VRLALAQQIPAAIEFDLELGEARAPGVIGPVAGGLAAQLTLFGDQPFDLAAKSRIIHQKP